MDKRLVINADDFGLCDGVNRAVAQAHTDGVLTSTTLMANMPAAEEAVKIAKEMPSLGVGIHLNLTEGPPVSKDQSVKECWSFTRIPFSRRTGGAQLGLSATR